MYEDDEATWHAILSGAEVSMDVTAVITATRGVRPDVVLPEERIFDRAEDGSVMIVRSFRGTELHDVVIYIPDDTA
jgi:hypothetical protein